MADGQLSLIKASASIDEKGEEIVSIAKAFFRELDGLEIGTRIATINALRVELAKHSPFSEEPVDCIQWVHTEDITANDYNPNTVAPPEMTLLEHSVASDGFTQPIVAWKNGAEYEVVDGFHRNRVGRECDEIRKRIHGYLPLTIINQAREDRGDRIASTIRHNRARGKHQVTAMSDIVLELKRRNWTDTKIGKELGMDPDEVLRLSQITGLAELFSDREFSDSWDIDAMTEPEMDFDGSEDPGE
jgi:ParB-like chromosome segregation protein Spo0J